ncbi:hypothetical protein U91I_01221 [alpha proteobacterium U9-1i]|nr:hypothetical protein U91I_01221 [alpha proteobacterium U9-1i]
MLDLQERLTKPAAPAKHWRNWYRVHKRMGVTKRVGVWHPGLTRGPDLFPSKDIAEQHALDFIAAVFPHTRSWFDYLGALPEGEEPSD